MAERDKAFLWETEALRSSPPRPMPARQPKRTVQVDDPDWLTLREANEATGIPIATLRKWARRDNVASYLQETAVGQLRMVSLRGIYQRADELGRDVKGEPPSSREPEGTPTAVGDDRKQTPTAEKPPARVTPADQEIPPGTMLVPIDAWDKMLMQLGNLHEAGQQLAEARERAAKAETEARFLRERLAELRIGYDETRASPGPTARPTVQEEPETTSDEPEPEPEEEAPAVEINIRDLGAPEPETSSKESEREEELLSLPQYSIEMIKHLYSTWRGRPRR